MVKSLQFPIWLHFCLIWWYNWRYMMWYVGPVTHSQNHPPKFNTGPRIGTASKNISCSLSKEGDTKQKKGAKLIQDSRTNKSVAQLCGTAKQEERRSKALAQSMQKKNRWEDKKLWSLYADFRPGIEFPQTVESQVEIITDAEHKNLYYDYRWQNAETNSCQ